MDLIGRAAEQSVDRLEFIRQIALLTRSLITADLITRQDAGAIRTAASRATFPLP